MDYARELEVALDAAAEASAYLRGAYEAFTPVPDAPASITTEADRTSQDLVLSRLKGAFPDDALCAEEGTEALRQPVRPRCLAEWRRRDAGEFKLPAGELRLLIAEPLDRRDHIGVLGKPREFPRNRRACFSGGAGSHG